MEFNQLRSVLVCSCPFYEKFDEENRIINYFAKCVCFKRRVYVLDLMNTERTPYDSEVRDFQSTDT